MSRKTMAVQEDNGKNRKGKELLVKEKPEMFVSGYLKIVLWTPLS